MQKKAIFLLMFLLTNFIHATTLEQKFLSESKKTSAESDIGEHLNDLAILSSQCESVCELGTRYMVSTVSILYGLSKNNSSKKYFGFDLTYPPEQIFSEIEHMAHINKIDFHFTTGNDLYLDIPQVDMLFIDTWHSYMHLSFELEKFHARANKFIALHDTSAPWGFENEPKYFESNFVYPSWIDTSKKGLWPAVLDFLDRHPEWALEYRKLNCNGFTVLKRKQ